MKKYLLIVALAVVGMVNAREFKTLPAQKTQIDFTAQKQAVDAGVEMVATDNFVSELRAKRAAQAEDYADVDWYYAPGQMQYGLMEGLSAYPIAGIILPAVDSVVWENYYGATDWTVYDGKTVENSETAVLEDTRGAFGGYSGILPTTTDHDFIASSGTSYRIKGTSFGLSASYRWLCLAPHEHYINGEDNLTMTLCAMYTDTLNGGDDFYQISNSDTRKGKYFNGTGRILDPDTQDYTADTIGIVVDNGANMKISQILLCVYNRDASEVQNMIPDGAEIRVALFPLNGNQINFEDTIASTIATNADLSGAPYGTIAVKFYEEDIFGTLTETPIYTGGSFYLQITNFNETGCDFGFFSDYYCPSTYTTVYQQDGKFKFINGGGANLAICFDGYYPTAFNDTTINELNAPVDGGFAYYGEDVDDNAIYIVTNTDPTGWDFDDRPDWITDVTYDDTYLDSYDVATLQFTVEALPDGTAYREGVVTIFADGAVLEFVVKQGTNPEEAIDNVNFKNDGKSYNVLGIEVNDDYKGVIIRNGEKFIR